MVRAGVECCIARGGGKASHDGLRPGPMRPCSDPDARKHHPVGRAKAAQLSQQRPREGTQGSGEVSRTGAVLGFFQSRSAGEGFDRWSNRARGPDKGEQLQHVERPKPCHPAAPGQRWHVTDQRRILGQRVAQRLSGQLLGRLPRRTPPQPATVPHQHGCRVHGQTL